MSVAVGGKITEIEGLNAPAHEVVDAQVCC